ncbi:MULTISPECIES: 4'-phosphopantetheinyl transferase superfamily protein [unclassified Streptomyces]|uniref:4'-phosphopantetheinyl transferase superfamily protein n=1 Tax=Streptomyces sp. NBC_00060 TaxID=2975636 RepID=A0AAU2HAW4_9ACTN
MGVASVPGPADDPAQHLAGRAALRAALSALGMDLPHVPRPTGGGPPPAPHGTATSITHKDSVAVAAAWHPAGPLGTDAAVYGIGVDVERVGYLPDRAAALLSVPAERERFAAVAGWEDPARILCAKEAAYKADPLLRNAPFLPRQVPLRPLSATAAACAEPHGRGLVATRRSLDYWISICLTFI